MVDTTSSGVGGEERATADGRDSADVAVSRRALLQAGVGVGATTIGVGPAAAATDTAGADTGSNGDGLAPPSDLTVLATRPTAVYIGWTRVEPDGSPGLCGHVVDVGGWPWTTEPGAASSTGVGYLPPQWSGTIGVTASDCEGNESERVTIEASTHPTAETYGLSLPPRNLRTHRYPRSIGVDWLEPVDTGEGGLSHYRVECSGREEPREVPPEKTSTWFEGLDLETDYTVRVTAVNSAGESAAVETRTSTTAPQQPSELTVLDLVPDNVSGPESLQCADESPGFRISWEPPGANTTDGADAHSFEGFDVFLDGERVDTVTEKRSGYGDWNTVVTGLEWDRTYEIGVRTDYGTSTSEPLTQTETTRTRNHPNPQSFEATEITDTSVTLTWQTRADCYASWYDISVDGERVTQVDSAATEVTLTGLSPGTQYRIGLDVYDIEGNESPYRAFTRVNTTDSTSPTKPTDLTVTRQEPTLIGIRWTAATDESERGVCRYDIDVGGYPWMSADGDVTSTELIELPPDWEGAIGVTAVDCSGNASERATVETSTPASEDEPRPPSPPRVDHVSPGPTTIQVRWEPPESTGAAELTGYRVYVDGQDSPVEEVGPEGGRAVVGDLRPETEHTIRVTAVNEAGESAPLVVEPKTSELRQPAQIYADPNPPREPGNTGCDGPYVRAGAGQIRAREYEGVEIYVDGQLHTTLSTDNEGVRIEDVEYGETYEISVVVDYGVGKTDPVTETVTVGELVPPEVTSLDTTRVGQQVANIYWSRPDPCLVSRYNVYVDGERVQELESPRDSTTVRSLDPGTTYEIAVAAVGPNGEEAEPGTIEVTTQPE